MKDPIKEMVLETVEGFYKSGTVDELTLREVKSLCLPEVKPYTPTAICRLRKKLKLSQAAFARFLNTTASTVRQWEYGNKRPSGIALKLLHIVDEKGLMGIL